jgi:hypothetical protein
MRTIVTTLLVVMVLSFTASATIFNVPSVLYPTIQSGVNAASAGDTVMVAAGTYFENVQINISLYLLGEDMYTTTIDAMGMNQGVLVPGVSGSYGKISGFTLTNSGVGIQPTGYAGAGIALNTGGSGNWEICWNYFYENPDNGYMSYDGGSVYRNIFEYNGWTGSYKHGIFASSNSNLHVYNNDFRDNYNGIYTHPAATSLMFENNIVTDNGTGVSMGIAAYTLQYNDVWNNTTNYVTCSPGTGDISADPSYVGGAPFDYHLTAGSPCIDAGNPLSPLDPDGTTADMGVYYFDQGGAPSLTITLTPYNPPIQIPASGGSFDFNIRIENTGTSSITFDGWIMASLVGGPQYGPLLGPVTVTIAAGGSISRDRTQMVPAGAPAGNYTYDGYVGLYPGTIWDEDHFNWEKLADGDGAPVSQWENFGESFEQWLATPAVEVASEFALMGAYPNPFNPTTTLRFDLAEATQVSLSVYNLSGSLVNTLVDGWRQPGSHEVTFDASGLPTGVYFAHLAAGDFASTQKLVLMK